ncbi:MAG: hypothetical protein KJZ70_00675 [Bryobacterales bacterium]|nr:hypothetical protein [Bryobacterales bacterium]
MQSGSDSRILASPNVVALRPAANGIPEISVRVPALDEMRAATLEALNALPPHGLEIGGVLVGRVETARDGAFKIMIDDFATFGISYEWGPVYQLSGEEAAAFQYRVRTAERAAGEGAVALGWWRSDTLDSQLRFRPEDRVFLEAFGGDGAALFLHFRPHPVAPFRCRAHVIEKDAIESCGEFTVAFDRGFAAAADLLRTTTRPSRTHGVSEEPVLRGMGRPYRPVRPTAHDRLN